MTQTATPTYGDLRALRVAGERPRLHPHGFVQVNLVPGGSLRLHVWDDDVPRTADDATLHDHVWSFDSYVLRGTLIHRVAAPVWKPDGAYMLWEATDARQDGLRGGKRLRPTGLRGDLLVEDEHVVEAGDSYSFAAFNFHDSVAEGFTATLFQKTHTFPGRPRILCEVGHHPDGVVPPTVSEDRLWDKIYEAVA